MNLRSKVALALVAVFMVASGWVGYRLRGDCEVAVNTNVRENVVTIKRPDGTVEKHKSRDTAVSSTPAKPALPKWSVQGDVRTPLDKLNDYTYSAYLYRRVSDTNLWFGAGVSSKKEAVIGIRIDF